MARSISRNGIDGVLEDLEYPITRNDAAVACDGVTIELVEEDANLGRVISETGSDIFTEPAELRVEVLEVLSSATDEVD